MTKAIKYDIINLRKRKKEGGTMFNKNKLSAKIIENGFSVQEIAEKLGINPSTLYRKMNSETDFTRNEITMLRDFLHFSLEEMNEIFFA